jgi:hypothetical protein
VSAEFVATRRVTVRTRDIPLALLAPRRVFARVEDVPAYGWPLVVLLTAVTMIGYAKIETGLIDRDVERRVQEGIAAMAIEQADVVERSALSRMIEEEREAGEFLRLMTRIRVLVARPLAALATVLLLSALFYGLVALTGRKPEWHTLMTVFVFAGFVDVVQAVVRLGFMLQYETLRADTSLAPLVELMAPEMVGGAAGLAVLWGLLSALDPFRVWFWILVGCGLATTSQLRGWKVWTGCTLCWLIAAVVRAGMAVATVSQAAPPA